MSTKTLLLVAAGAGVAWYFLRSKTTAHTTAAPVPDQTSVNRPGAPPDGSSSTWTDPSAIEDVNTGIPPLVEPPFPDPYSAGVDPNFAGHDITTVTRP